MRSAPAAPEADAAPHVEETPAAGDADAAPPRPTAPTIMSAGGVVLKTPKLLVATFGDEPVAPALETFAKTIGATPYWKDVTSEYCVGPAEFARSVKFTDVPTTITQSGIEKWLAGQLDGTHAEWGAPDPSTIYTLVFTKETQILVDGVACSGGPPAWHGEIKPTGGTARVPYAVITRCEPYFDLAGIDFVTSGLSHEWLEASTNPFYPGGIVRGCAIRSSGSRASCSRRSDDVAVERGARGWSPSSSTLPDGAACLEVHLAEPRSLLRGRDDPALISPIGDEDAPRRQRDSPRLHEPASYDSRWRASTSSHRTGGDGALRHVDPVEVGARRDDTARRMDAVVALEDDRRARATTRSLALQDARGARDVGPRDQTSLDDEALGVRARRNERGARAAVRGRHIREQTHLHAGRARRRDPTRGPVRFRGVDRQVQERAVGRIRDVVQVADRRDDARGERVLVHGGLRARQPAHANARDVTTVGRTETVDLRVLFSGR